MAWAGLTFDLVMALPLPAFPALPGNGQPPAPTPFPRRLGASPNHSNHVCRTALTTSRLHADPGVREGTAIWRRLCNRWWQPVPTGDCHSEGPGATKFRSSAPPTCPSPGPLLSFLTAPPLAPGLTAPGHCHLADRPLRHLRGRSPPPPHSTPKSHTAPRTPTGKSLAPGCPCPQPS